MLDEIKKIKQVLKPIYVLWMCIARAVGHVVTTVILFFLFYLVITPVSLISRLAEHKYLDLNFDDKKDSYWMYKKKEEVDKQIYERQY